LQNLMQRTGTGSHESVRFPTPNLRPDHVNMQGLHVPLNNKLPAGLEGGGSLCYQDARNASIWSPRANSPHELHQGRLRAPSFLRRLFASANVQYVSKKSSLAGNYAKG
jgi:hypothetical protein